MTEIIGNYRPSFLAWPAALAAAPPESLFFRAAVEARGRASRFSAPARSTRLQAE
jgi:hypothetical protein